MTVYEAIRNYTVEQMADLFATIAIEAVDTIGGNLGITIPEDIKCDVREKYVVSLQQELPVDGEL